MRSEGETLTLCVDTYISIGFGLSLGRPLAIVVAMSGIGVSGITVVEARVSVSCHRKINVEL